MGRRGGDSLSCCSSTQRHGACQSVSGAKLRVSPVTLPEEGTKEATSPPPPRRTPEDVAVASVHLSATQFNVSSGDARVTGEEEERLLGHAAVGLLEHSEEGGEGEGEEVEGKKRKS